MHDFCKSLINSALRKVLKRLHYPLVVMLTCVRWYVAYPLSLRDIEEMMQERGVFVSHSTVHRWSIKVAPVMAAIFRRHKRHVGVSWLMNETQIKVAGKWKYLCRAVDRAGDTVYFLLTAKRDKAAARRSLERAINLQGVPEKITIGPQHGLRNDPGTGRSQRHRNVLRHHSFELRGPHPGSFGAYC